MKALMLGALISVAMIGGVSAQTAEEQQACMDDAFRLCGAAIPDRAKVTVCMIQNKDRVSRGCYAVMARHGRPDSQDKTYSARRSVGTTGSRASDD